MVSITTGGTSTGPSTMRAAASTSRRRGVGRAGVARVHPGDGLACAGRRHPGRGPGRCRPRDRRDRPCARGRRRAARSRGRRRARRSRPDAVPRRRHRHDHGRPLQHVPRCGDRSRVAALRGDPALRGLHAAPEAIASSTCARAAAASRVPAELQQSAAAEPRTSPVQDRRRPRRAAPRSPRATSSALPTARPSGASMSVSTHVDALARARADARRISRASSRASLDASS